MPTATNGDRRVVQRRGLAAFTLVELLVVIALIAGLTVFLLGDLSGGGISAAQQSAQTTVSGLIMVSRTKALSSGQAARILLNIDPTSSVETERYLRYFVVQTQVSAVWQTMSELYLPNGVYVVPGDFTSLPAGLFAADEGAWFRVDGVSVLRSTVLRSSQISSETINSDVAEQWVAFSISAAGTTSQSGDIVLASGLKRAPGSFAIGESPIQLRNRENVCGISLSAYGVAVLIADRSSF